MVSSARNHHRLPLAVAALTAILVSAGSATAARAAASAEPQPTGSTTVISNCVDRKVEPRRVIIACGDGALFLGIKSYRYWSATSAVGDGAIRQDDCDPNCAAGTFVYTPARIRLYHAVSTPQGPVFTRAIATFHYRGATKHSIFYLLRKPIS